MYVVPSLCTMFTKYLFIQTSSSVILPADLQTFESYSCRIRHIHLYSFKEKVSNHIYSSITRHKYFQQKLWFFPRSQMFRYLLVQQYLGRKPSHPSSHPTIFPFHDRHTQYHRRQRNPPGLVLVWDYSLASIKLDVPSTFIPSSGRNVNNVYSGPTRLFQEINHPGTLP